MENNNETITLFPYQISFYPEGNNAKWFGDPIVTAEAQQKMKEFGIGQVPYSYNQGFGVSVQAPILLQVKADGFTLYRIDHELRELVSGTIDPESKFGPGGGTIYGKSEQGWEYSFHCFGCKDLGLTFPVKPDSDSTAEPPISG